MSIERNNSARPRPGGDARGMKLGLSGLLALAFVGSWMAVVQPGAGSAGSTDGAREAATQGSAASDPTAAGSAVPSPNVMPESAATARAETGATSAAVGATTGTTLAAETRGEAPRRHRRHGGRSRFTPGGEWSNGAVASAPVEHEGESRESREADESGEGGREEARGWAPPADEAAQPAPEVMAPAPVVAAAPRSFRVRTRSS